MAFLVLKGVMPGEQRLHTPTEGTSGMQVQRNVLQRGSCREVLMQTEVPLKPVRKII